jgi:hypothetical protein
LPRNSRPSGVSNRSLTRLKILSRWLRIRAFAHRLRDR